MNYIFDFKSSYWFWTNTVFDITMNYVIQVSTEGTQAICLKHNGQNKNT